MDAIAIFLTVAVAFYCGGCFVSYLDNAAITRLHRRLSYLLDENSEYRKTLIETKEEVVRLQALIDFKERSYEDESMFHVKQAS